MNRASLSMKFLSSMQPPKASPRPWAQLIPSQFGVRLETLMQRTKLMYLPQALSCSLGELTAAWHLIPWNMQPVHRGIISELRRAHCATSVSLKKEIFQTFHIISGQPPSITSLVPLELGKPQQGLWFGALFLPLSLVLSSLCSLLLAPLNSASTIACFPFLNAMLGMPDLWRISAKFLRSNSLLWFLRSKLSNVWVLSSYSLKFQTLEMIQLSAPNFT